MIMNDPLKKYRRQYREWKSNARLKQESNCYCLVFKKRNLIIPDDVAIRKAITSKFPRLTPKTKGSLDIVAIYHNYNWENESLKPALEKFGSVQHYDWYDRFNHQKNEKKWHKSVKSEMNIDLINRVKAWGRIDVIFTYLSGEIVKPDTVKKIASSGVPMINLALNDKESFVGKIKNGQAMGVRDICRYFDLCWTSTEDALIKYCVEGALPIYLPEGANPEIHKPYDVKKTIDVSFVGQCYGSRPEIIQQLKLQGIDVEAYGHGWSNGPLSTEEMVRLYSRTKINLGFGGVAGHKDTYCVKGRDFEIPMSGGLYLTEYHPELEKCYELEKEIVTYKDMDDLKNKIHYLLSNPEQADEIRKKGTCRAHNEHTWKMRFGKIFNLLGLV